MTGIVSSRTGRQGEKIFSKLCTDADVTCNPSLEDDQGWDWLLEYPVVNGLNKPIDLQPAAKTAFVQIKATRGSTRSCRIKLSNALRMAKSPSPQFIVLVALDPKGGARRVYVAHVWDKLIAQFLKAGRVADSRGETATHRRMLTVSFAEDDARADPIGWIAEQIDAAGKDYAGAKTAIIDSAGFEKGYGKAVVTFDAEDLDAFVDLQLGLKDGLRFSNFTYISERFGIPAASMEIDGEGGTIHITPNPRRGTMRLSTAAGDELVLPAEIVSARLPGDAERYRTRITAGCLDLILGDGKTRADATLDHQTAHTLDEIGHFTTLIGWHDKGEVDVRLNLDGEHLVLPSLSLGTERLRGWADIGHGVDVMRRIAKAGLRDDVRLSVEDIHEATMPLGVLSALASDRVLKIEFTPQPGAPAAFTGLLGYAAADVAGWAFLALAYRPVVEDLRKDAWCHLTFGPARVIDARAERGEAADHLDHFRGRHEAVLRRLSADGEILDVGDFRTTVVSGGNPGPDIGKEPRPGGGRR